MKHSKLTFVVGKHSLICAVVVEANGEMIHSVGANDNPAIGGVYSAILGPYGDAQNSFNSLEGMLLPQITSQGGAFSISSKPTSDLMVVSFGITTLGAREMYEFSKAVDADVQAVYPNVAYKRMQSDAAKPRR
jgi:hypothetical protein